MQIDNTNLYLSGETGGIAPAGNQDQRLVSTGNFAEAIEFEAASNGNGQITVISASGATLFSDQDKLQGSGNGPVYFDDISAYNSGDYYPVQFCLQPDDTFVVQNLGDINKPNDDANIVQMCAAGSDNFLQLHNAAVAASSSNCNTVRLRIAQPSLGYGGPTTTTTTTTTSTTTSSTSSAAMSPTCEVGQPVPNGQLFRIKRASNSEYLFDSDSRYGDPHVALMAMSGPSPGRIFAAAPGTNGQITFNDFMGTPLYSNQYTPDDHPGAFDIFSYNSGLISGFRNNPVLFCLQPDDSFILQNLGSDLQDPTDDAVNLLICADGTVFLTRQVDGPGTTWVGSDCLPDQLLIERVT